MNESLHGLRARSTAIRATTSETLDEATGREKTLSDTLERSADNHERAEVQTTTWPNTPED